MRKAVYVGTLKTPTKRFTGDRVLARKHFFFVF